MVVRAGEMNAWLVGKKKGKAYYSHEQSRLGRRYMEYLNS